MPDETVHCLERIRPKLKTNAVPLRTDGQLMAEKIVEPDANRSSNFNTEQVLVQTPASLEPMRMTLATNSMPRMFLFKHPQVSKLMMTLPTNSMPRKLLFKYP